MSLNRVALIGRLVRDPEPRTTNTGKSVVEASIAVQKRIKPTDPNQPDADFFRVKAWNQQADYLANYGGKGRLVAVDGRLESRKYVDKEGNSREIVEIVADHVSLLDKAGEGSGGQGAQGGYSSVSRNQGGQGGGRPQGQGRGPTPSADEYDPFADE